MAAPRHARTLPTPPELRLLTRALAKPDRMLWRPGADLATPDRTAQRCAEHGWLERVEPPPGQPDPCLWRLTEAGHTMFHRRATRADYALLRALQHREGTVGWPDCPTCPPVRPAL